jgi:hypothetical protein
MFDGYIDFIHPDQISEKNFVQVLIFRPVKIKRWLVFQSKPKFPVIAQNFPVTLDKKWQISGF